MLANLVSLLEDHAARHRMPGAALAVMIDGDTAMAVTGVADVSTGEPVTTDTRFAIGSLTKPMVTMALSDLSKSGLFDMNDAVSTLLPSLEDSPWARQATLRDLITGRSRIPLTIETEFSLSGNDREVLTRNAATLAGSEPSGPHWSYSNFAWCILGAVMEHVTSRVWEEAMTQILLKPMGMTQTAFSRQPQEEPRATGHEVGSEGVSPAEPWTDRAYCSAGSGILSTTADLIRFAKRHLQDPDLGEFQQTFANVSIHSWFDAWGLGWGRFDWPPVTAWGWDGVLSGQRSFLRVIPELDSAAVLLTNGSNGRSMYRSLFEELLHAMFNVRVPKPLLDPSPGSAGQLDRFAGTYSWPDREYQVVDRGDSLVLRWDDQEAEARPVSDRVFVTDPTDHDMPTITFGGFDSDGRPHVLYRMLWGYPRV